MMKMWLAIAICIAAAQAYSECGTMKDPTPDQTNGTVRIPLVYPDKYAGGLKCAMNIPAKVGYHIKMVLKRMSTEEYNDELKVRYTKIKNGREKTKIEYFSGYYPASVMPQTYNYPIGSGLNITFTTTAWYTSTGFEFTWAYVGEPKENMTKEANEVKTVEKAKEVETVTEAKGVNDDSRKNATQVEGSTEAKTVKRAKEVVESVKEVKNEKKALLVEKAAKAMIEAAKEVKEAVKVVKVAAEEARAKNVKIANDPNCGSMTTPAADQTSGTVRVPLAYPKSYAINLSCQMKIPPAGDGYRVKIVLKRLKTESSDKLTIYYNNSGTVSRWDRKTDISFSGSPTTPVTRTYPPGAGVEIEFRTSRYAQAIPTGFELTWEYSKE